MKCKYENQVTASKQCWSLKKRRDRFCKMLPFQNYCPSSSLYICGRAEEQEIRQIHRQRRSSYVGWAGAEVL